MGTFIEQQVSLVNSGSFAVSTRLIGNQISIVQLEYIHVCISRFLLEKTAHYAGAS